MQRRIQEDGRLVQRLLMVVPKEFFMFRISPLAGFCCILLVLLPDQCLADRFGSGENAFEIPFVTIGDAGNAPDTTGDPNPAGAVPYEYRIGKYEIPEEAIRKANALSNAAGDPLAITLDDRGPQKPATRVSWFEAARFVNWLNEDKGATPAYKFDAGGDFQLWDPGDVGYDSDNRFRNTGALYFLPSADEWYKAAFYDPVEDTYWDFATGSDDEPIPVASGTIQGTAIWNPVDAPVGDQPADVRLAGGSSVYLTIGQSGNVLEWEETERALINNDPLALRGARGGDYLLTITALNLSSEFRNFSLPVNNPSNVGFRIASAIPEPRTLSHAVVGVAALVLRGAYRRQR
ncbi:MAG: SUMF1/EgtB/PvdO family nonheme iron enzyme, partial [Aeoliella sp.]